MGKERDIKNQKDLNKEIQNQISLEQEIIQLLSKRAGIDADILSDQRDIANVIKDQTAQLKFQNAEKRDLRSLTNQITKIAKEGYAISVDELGLTKTNNDLAKKQAQLNKNLILLDQQRNDLAKRENNINKDLVETINEQIDAAKNLRDNLGEIAEKSTKISNDFGVKTFGALSDITKKIPGLSRLSGPFEEAAEAARSTATSNLLGPKGAKNVSTLKAGFKALGPIIKKALGPASIILAIVNAFKALVKIDKDVTSIAKQMNVTKEEAGEIRKRMFQVSNQASTFANIQKGNSIIQKDIVKGQTEFNNLLGTSIDLTSSLGEEGKILLAQFSSISKFLKLSKDEQKGLLDLSLTTGKSVDDIKNSVLGTTRLRKVQTGILVDERKILESVLTASAATKLTMMGQRRELAGAAFEAAKLGLNFSDLEKTSSSLLDFQSSIESEMAAELLTGKQLNLERARAAALAGDQETLARELSKQIGTSAEFSRMNVIQQEALAKALGMNRDELAQTLISQESLNKLRGNFNVLGKETIENLKTEGKINEATYKNLVNGTAASIEYYNALKQSGMAQEEIVKLLGEESAASLEAQSAQDKFNDALEQVKDKFRALVDGGILDKLVNGLVGLTESKFFKRFIATGEKTEILPVNSDTANDFISRPGQPIQKFRKDDIIVGGTNLGGGNEEVVTLLKELITAVKAGGDVYMDGAKVGKSIALATSRIG